MSVNKVTLLGNLCHDPSVKTFESGQKVAQFSLATNKKGYTLQNGTTVPEQTEFHNIVVWGKLAEVAEKYLKKGDKLYLEGELRTRSYDDKNGGAKRYITEIYVSTFEMLTPKATGAGTPPPPSTQGENPNPAPEPNDDLPF